MRHFFYFFSTDFPDLFFKQFARRMIAVDLPRIIIHPVFNRRYFFICFFIEVCSFRNMSSDHFINRKLTGKVEPKLEQTLNTAFQKAFTLVFDKGVGIIQKTYNANKIKEKHNSIDSKLTRKNIRKQINVSKSSNIKNLAITSISSTTLGILGIGIPDIFLFTALIIKNLQEISLSYGIDFNNEKEKYFMLMIIEGALSHESIYEINEKIDSIIESDYSYDIDFQIKQTSKTLASELLYLKFIQGIPIVGIISGFYDTKYMNQISKYANLKYQLRFLKNKL